MSIVKLIDLPNKSKLGIWHIEENGGTLERQLQLDEEELNLLASIRHTKRYQHWLGSRVLLRNMLNTNAFISLKADARNKPYLENFPHQLSISHSGEYAAVIISEECEVGIDIERISPKVLKVKERFLNEAELKMLNGMDEQQMINCGILFWSAKESLFKLYARGNIDFRQQLLIPNGQAPDANPLKGIIRKNGNSREILVHHMQVEGYMVCYCWADTQ